MVVHVSSIKLIIVHHVFPCPVRQVASMTGGISATDLSAFLRKVNVWLDFRSNRLQKPEALQSNLLTILLSC